MKTTEIVGYKREDLGTSASKALRADGNVPCVVYGGKDVIHFTSPMYLFKELLYTPDAYIVNLNVEGVEKKCILKDVQFHPVSDMLLHVDLLEISDKKPVVMDIPVKVVGQAPGVMSGGIVYVKSKKLKVKALPANLPQYVEVDVSDLDLGKSIKVMDVAAEGFEIVTPDRVTIVGVIIPRALKSALKDDEAEAEAEAEAAEAAEGAEA